MNRIPPAGQQTKLPPRAIAISGILFSVLFMLSLTLVRASVPADPADPGNWLADPAFRNGVRSALNLVPFTGIAFLWFMAVLRNRIGSQEDRLLATVFLGSGLLFVAMLFAGAAISRAILESFGAGVSADHDTYRVGRRMTYELINTFGMRMVAVFMFVTSTIGLRTGALCRSVSFVGYLFGLILLITITAFAWIALLFPLWALLVSTYILFSDIHERRGLDASHPDPGRTGRTDGNQAP